MQHCKPHDGGQDSRRVNTTAVVWQGCEASHHGGELGQRVGRGRQVGLVAADRDEVLGPAHVALADVGTFGAQAGQQRSQQELQRNIKPRRRRDRHRRRRGGTDIPE